MWRRRPEPKPGRRRREGPQNRSHDPGGGRKAGGAPGRRCTRRLSSPGRISPSSGPRLRPPEIPAPAGEADNHAVTGEKKGKFKGSE